MPTIEAFIEPRAPLNPADVCAEALARFEREPDALLLAVVEAGRPLGTIERDGFLRRLARADREADIMNRPIPEMMDAEAVVIEGSTKLDGLADILLAQSAQNLMRGFVVVRDGAYLGVCSLVGLLKAEHDLRREAETARADAAQTVRAAEARSSFLSLLSRELRTPMNGVAAVADLLSRQPIGPDAQAYVQTIIDSSETTLRILEDALDLARAEVGELTIDPKPVLLRQMMDDLQATWAPRAAQDGVSLMIRFEGDTELAAEIDGPRLRQVFNQLIGNALKFARNGVVEAFLAAKSAGDMITLKARVRDNGPGIAPDRVPSLFDHTAAHGVVRAGGLGLPICHQVLKAMGGTIGVESNIGQGCTFAFDLSAPKAMIGADTVSGPETSTVSLSTDTRVPNVLIVDDNGTNRIVAQALCDMFGCTSSQVEDGLEAVEAAKTGRYDLILMDIKMPRMDGVEATLAIRALEGDKARVPIIALTANADPDDAKRYIAAGMATVVEKPIKPERLIEAMNAALSPATDLEEDKTHRRVA